MVRLAVFFLCCLRLFADRHAQPGHPMPPVVLISFDGLAADQFTAKSMPRVWKLARTGATGRGLPPFPATTFNGHASLATGCWPGHHGIVGNGFLDPEKGDVPYSATAEHLQREPLWVAATRSGVRTAVYQWPCGTGPWEGVAPWRLEPYRGRRPDRDMFAFVSQALAEGARLVLAYHTGTDTVGHHNGPGTRAMARRLAELDRELAPWLERLRADHPGIRLILTGDHGMARMRHRIILPHLLDGLDIHPVAHGGSAYLYLSVPEQKAEAMQRLLKAGLQVWTREGLPETFHLGMNRRVGDLVVLAPLGTWLAQSTGDGFLDEAKGRSGAHAYTPDQPSMQSWLVVFGAGKLDLGPVPLWDVAPTLARWLDIRWAVAPDGRPIPALVSASVPASGR